MKLRAIIVVFLLALAGAACSASGASPKANKSQAPHSVHLACEKQVRQEHFVPVRGPVPEVKPKDIVPGLPAAAIGCRYEWSGGALRLVSSRSVPVRKLQLALNRAPDVPVPNNRLCLAIAGGELRYDFSYSDGTVVRIATSLSGCMDTTNGVRTVLSPHEVFALAPPPVPVP